MTKKTYAIIVLVLGIFTSLIGQTVTFNPALAPFYHGVASGDPLSDRVIIWTRITPTDMTSDVEVEYFVSEDTAFTTLTASGRFTTNSTRDYTVKIDVAGLNPETTYYYYFKGLGASSVIGRTRTTPLHHSDQLKFAVVSCSNFEAGFFNAYKKIAAIKDLDAVIHLGDYIYEYQVNFYGDQSLDRKNDPQHEIVTQEDYRTRYSLYRLDPDLQAAHQQHPFIAIWDDHETTNDSYKEGAENHNPDRVYDGINTEGLWKDRVSAAKKVYFEWIPIRDNQNLEIRRTISYGDLADLICLDTRLEARTKQIESITDPITQDLSQHTILGETQRNWLIDELDKSTAQWKIICNQVIFSQLNVGFAAGFNDGVPDITNLDSIQAVEGLFVDIWDGYPLERALIIDSLESKGINDVIILTGDFHSSFAFDVTQNPVNYPNPLANNLPTPSFTYNPITGAGSRAVEFAVPSITSANFDENVGPAAAAQFEFSMNNNLASIFPVNPGFPIVYNPHMKYVDLDRHGYVLLNLESDSAKGEFYYVSTIAETNATLELGSVNGTPSGPINHLTTGLGASLEKPNAPALAPSTATVVTGLNSTPKEIRILNAYPLPAQDQLTIDFVNNSQNEVTLKLRKVESGVWLKKLKSPLNSGYNKIHLSVSDLDAGIYLLEVATPNSKDQIKVIIQQ